MKAINLGLSFLVISFLVDSYLVFS